MKGFSLSFSLSPALIKRPVLGSYQIRAVCEPEEAGTVTGCVEAAHYVDSVELDVTPAAGWKIVGWSDDPHFDGDHRDIDVYEDLDLVVYLEEIETEGE